MAASPMQYAIGMPSAMKTKNSTSIRPMLTACGPSGHQRRVRLRFQVSSISSASSAAPTGIAR